MPSSLDPSVPSWSVLPTSSAPDRSWDAVVDSCPGTVKLGPGRGAEGATFILDNCLTFTGKPTEGDSEACYSYSPGAAVTVDALCMMWPEWKARMADSAESGACSSPDWSKTTESRLPGDYNAADEFLSYLAHSIGPDTRFRRLEGQDLLGTNIHTVGQPPVNGIFMTPASRSGPLTIVFTDQSMDVSLLPAMIKSKRNFEGDRVKVAQVSSDTVSHTLKACTRKLHPVTLVDQHVRHEDSAGSFFVPQRPLSSE